MIDFFIYSKKGINAISLVISILIYLSLSFIIPKSSSTVKIKADLLTTESAYIYSKKDENWYLEIPKIDLVAQIREGTDSENLNKYIGHFEETVKENGNIGLAGHNRGYKVNYFERIKELEKGDLIFYTYNRKKNEICG